MKKSLYRQVMFVISSILVWSRLVEYAGQCNQAAASVSKENIDRNIRDLFSKNNIIQLPPDPITAIDLFIPTIALIGAWKEDNEFDRKMIEQISGMEYSEFEAKARTMLSQNSEYLQLMNGNWKVCHKEELLNQCKNKLFDDSIGKLLEAVESILRQKSKCVASKMPYFIPVSGEYDNSLELRGNLVKSLCWVKKNLSELSQCNQEKIENNIYTLVSTLLQDAKWITWTSLRDCLQNLAELSPEAFLKEAERGIINNPTEIVNLFPPKSGELSGINYISNLLWALEILAWSPEYLVHSISVHHFRRHIFRGCGRAGDQSGHHAPPDGVADRVHPAAWSWTSKSREQRICRCIGFHRKLPE